MKFTLNIDANNAAFHDEDCNGEDFTKSHHINGLCRCFAMEMELSVILWTIAKDIAQNGISGFFETIYDSNGNDVGRWALKPDSYK